ncbi:MAG: MlaD family protein [Candidatus Omnitrophica bacterium]|nr:MlaD family protein [Candidatus Omnitrophota bacterium]
MNSARFEWKVGLFILVGLVVLAALLLEFSKGITWFASTYSLRLIAQNVGTIRPDAVVLMAGVPVGRVAQTDLSPDGRSVTITVDIYERYNIPTNAEFVIDQAGFLGDEFISITPSQKLAPFFTNNAQVYCQQPFNLQDAARTASVLMKQLDHTARIVDAAVQRVDRILLADTSLTNMVAAVSNFNQFSARAGALVSNVDLLIVSNRNSVHLSLSNLTALSGELVQVGRDLSQAWRSNQAGISGTIKHLESATGKANQLLTDLEHGQGLAGSLLKDESMRHDFTLLVSNLTQLSSNLNRFGLLYKPRLPKPPPPWEGFYPAKNPLGY